MRAPWAITSIHEHLAILTVLIFSGYEFQSAMWAVIDWIPDPSKATTANNIFNIDSNCIRRCIIDIVHTIHWHIIMQKAVLRTGHWAPHKLMLRRADEEEEDNGERAQCIKKERKKVPMKREIERERARAVLYKLAIPERLWNSTPIAISRCSCTTLDNGAEQQERERGLLL